MTGGPLTTAEACVDGDLGGQYVGVRLAFPNGCMCVYAEGADDSICVSDAFPEVLSGESIRHSPVPARWTSAIGHPILWAWAMTNTQGRVDGLQIEFGTVDHPSTTLQILVRASTLVLRTL